MRNNKRGKILETKPTLNELPDGTKQWWMNGVLHREDGPAFEGLFGYKAWFLNGQPHRLDGPAIETADGHKEWWVNGERHRIDGPAYERADGYKDWFLNGKFYTEEEYIKRTQPVKELTIAEIEALLGHKVKVVK